MRDPRLLSRALAEAFLAGRWSARELTARGAVVVGGRPPWLAPLARRIAKMEARDVDAIAKRIQAGAAFRTATRPPAEIPIVRRWLFREPAFMPGRFDVPALATAGELAAWLGLTPGQLDALADLHGRGRRAREKHRHYRSTWIARPGAAPRLLEAPRPLLLVLQRAVLRDVLDRVPAHDAAHGFVRGRSAITFATPHADKEVVVRLDLEGFFGSVSNARVAAIFATLGYPRDVARLLAGLATTRAPIEVIAAAPAADVASAIGPRFRALRRAAESHLPQGAPTSPSLANLAAFGLDVRLAAAARAAGVTYTRYADDLAFSGDAAFADASTAWVALVARVAAEEGFRLNARKTRVARAGVQQRLAGLVVNAAPAVPRAERERLEAILHRCATRGAAGENRERHPDFRAHLRGRIAWVEAACPRHAERLLRLFGAIDWSTIP
ncbi:MAG TPA: reverse transcriptase family protein [Byssovorax sp.]|jgi:hypothetical protein